MEQTKNAVLNSWDFIKNEYLIPVIDSSKATEAVGKLDLVGFKSNHVPSFLGVLAGGVCVGASALVIPDDLFKNECSIFYQKLCKYCDEMNISESELYNRAKVSRAVFSNIRSMSKKPYFPSKLTIMCLCIALHLELKKTQELLAILGYSLSNNIIIDKVVAWCLEHHDLDFDVDSINDVIYEKTDGKYCLIKAS